MSGRFSGSAVIDRPIEEVFDYLGEGTNDPEFSPRVLSIQKEPAGPSGVGTVFVSQVKDAGMKTDRRFELTEFQSPTTIRWTERSKNLVTARRVAMTWRIWATRRRGSPFSTPSPVMASAS